MIYIVVEATRDTITLWDGVTKLDKHPDKPGGLMTMTIPLHDFLVDDKVQLRLTRVEA